MEEDELGTQRSVSHAQYVACSRCGRMTALEAASVVPGDTFQDQSEYSYLCPDCQQTLAAGEQDLPTTLA